MGEGGEGEEGVVPVRPNTLVTLTSLTGILPESMIVALLHLYEEIGVWDEEDVRWIVEACCCWFVSLSLGVFWRLRFVV